MSVEDSLREIDGVLSVKTHEVRGSTYTAVRISTTDMTPTYLIDTLQEIEDTRPALFDGSISTDGLREVIVEYEHP